MSLPKIGIIGVGWIGAQFKRYFEEIHGHTRGQNLFLYDTDIKERYFDDINNADVIFICLPTPRNPKDGSCDISFIADALRKIEGNKVIVIKSTVPPGTTESFQNQYPNHKLLFNPEFLTESRAWEDMVRPDRQIVGFTEISIEAANFVLSLLPKAPFMSPWGLNTYQPIRISATEAEFIKYASNIHFVRKVNWANALASAAAKMGVSYENIKRGMAADHRIGDSHLDVYQGGYRGWGGYCFPKDLDAFIQFTKGLDLSVAVAMLEADRKFNEVLLEEQGLTLEDVSHHIDKLEQRFNNNKKQ